MIAFADLPCLTLIGIFSSIAEEIAGRSAIYSRPTLILQRDARAFADLASFLHLNSQLFLVGIKEKLAT